VPVTPFEKRVRRWGWISPTLTGTANLDFFVPRCEPTHRCLRKPYRHPLRDAAISESPVWLRNVLFPRGDNTYAEIANYSGVTATELGMATCSWSRPDGYEDILVDNACR